MSGRRYLPIVIFFLTVIGVHLLSAALEKTQYLTQLTMTGYYSLVIIGLCTLTGYAGQISIGHAGFFAIGGYMSAYLTTHNLYAIRGTSFVSFLSKAGALNKGQDLYGGDIIVFNPWLACVLAVFFTVAVAYLIGGPVLKLKGHYLAMATLGFGTIVYKFVIGAEFLGAADGLSEIPSFKLLPGLDVSGKPDLRIQNYYIAWGLVTLGMFLLTNLIHSRTGRALRAIHGAEDAADAMGINTAKYKLKVFVLSAAFAAVGGVFLTHFNGGIGPSEASIMKSVRYVAIVAVGGMANLWGALTMGTILNFLSLRGYFGSYDDAVFGGILIVIMLFAPEGLLGNRLFRRIRDGLSASSAKGERVI